MIRNHHHLADIVVHVVSGAEFQVDVLRIRQLPGKRVHQRASLVSVQEEEHATGGDAVGDVVIRDKDSAVDLTVGEAEEGAVTEREPREQRW